MRPVPVEEVVVSALGRMERRLAGREAWDTGWRRTEIAPIPLAGSRP
jgi:hypothetical protein